MRRPTPQRLECLDGLRGVLAVYVMLGHMAPFAALPSWSQSLLSHGGAAVDVFFVLSGLVILRSLQGCGFAARPFLIARAARIFPVYLVMLAAGIAAEALPAPFAAMPWIGSESLAHGIWSQGWPAHPVREIAAHLTMTHGLFPNGVLPDVWVSFLGAAWSLSTEWQFYLLALLLGRTRRGAAGRAAWLAAALLALAMAGLAWDWLAPEAWRFSRAFLPNKAHYFALGIASALWVDRRAESGAGWTFACVLAATLALCAARGGWEKLLPPLLWTLCLTAQMRPLRLAPVAAALRWPVAQWLGAVSYPLYLANEPIQKALGWALVPMVEGNGGLFTVLWLPSAALLPLAAAALLHRAVETPAQRWGRTLTRRDAKHGADPVRDGVPRPPPLRPPSPGAADMA